ncbi:hypothetical protein MKW92_000226 [Papaver armeniacum]|nr:hypothetical protein MKW92_000226 [Papaver armeniacum]
MADALLSFLINEVGSVFEREISQEVRLVLGVRKEIEKLRSTFMNLKAVLNDAEQRQMDEPSVKDWVSKLKNAAYEMEDVLDEWATEILRSQLKLDEDDEGETKTKTNQVPKLSSYFCSPFSCFNQVAMRRDIASRIKQIRETLENIKNERDKFNFMASDQSAREGPYTYERKETSSIIIDRIFGRDSDRETVVNRLLGVETSTNQMENEAKDPRIISIFGMGGLGKTSLAQLVFDHEKVKSQFKLTMWVCVSDPFDRTKVAKAIFRAAKGKETNASTWDSLFKELCESVKEKKFLLVLDDVCTSDPNNLKELTHLLDHGDEGSRILVTTRREAVVSELKSYKHILQGLNPEDSSSLLFCKAFHGKEKEKSELLEDIGTRISNKCDGLPLALIHHLRYLRVLKLKNMGIIDIPNEIDKLIHLRYLDLSWNTELSELPDSMCGLINLQTLKLKHCYKLIKLPKDMGKLIKLRNLDIRDSGLMFLPEGIRNWTSLQTLSTFIVSAAEEGCKIEELKHLDHLKECLEIKGLGRLKSEEQAAEAILQTMSQLTELQLDFDRCEETLASPLSDSELQLDFDRCAETSASPSSESEIFQPSSEEGRLMESTLGNLQPHANLKRMTIGNYSGSKFPSWMGDVKALANLRFLKLVKCNTCDELPAMGLLPSLEELVIEDLKNLKRIGVEIYGGGQCVTEVAFPKLITLEIRETDNLEVWEFGNGVREMMPRVKTIKLYACDNLIALPALDKLPSLESLKIDFADQLTSIGCNTMSSDGGTSYPKLATLSISSARNLEVIVRGALTEGEKGNTMPCLVDLELRECPKLISLPRHLSSLTSLTLRDAFWGRRRDQLLVHLRDIPQFEDLKRLRLESDFYKSCKLIPEYVKNLTKLEHLDICNTRCRKYEGGDWSVLSHIPDIIFNGKKIDPLTDSPSISSYGSSFRFPVNVIWQEESLKVEIEANLPPIFLKSQLYYLTGVPAERQKLMIHGYLIEDDDEWTDWLSVYGETLTMTGTTDEIVKAPEQGPVFMAEDLPGEEQSIVVGHTAGLYNLGNTCYMNSTLQCLHSVPELKAELIKYPGEINYYDMAHGLTVAIRDLLGELDRSVKPVPPDEVLDDAVFKVSTV